VVDGSSIGAVNSYTFSDVKEDHSISATFVKATSYVITASAGSHGKISPSGDTEVSPGEDQTCVITPDKGYLVDSVLVDGEKVKTKSTKTNAVTYSFTKASSNHVISVSFKKAHTIKAPSMVKAKEKTSSSVRITWKKVRGAVKYKVYKAVKKSGKYKLAGTVKGNNKTVKGLKRGHVYWFKVKTFGKASVSRYSKIVKVVIK